MSEIIEKISYKTSKRLADAKMIDGEDISIYAYNLQVKSERFVAFAGAFIIATIIGYLLETIVFVTAFALVREFTGGYHCKTFLGCFFLSVTTILLSIPLVLIYEKHLCVFFITVAISLILILLIGSTSDIDSGFSEEEIKLVKRMGRYMCVFVVALMLLAYQIHTIRQLSLYIGTSVIQVAFYLIIAKILHRRKTNYEE